MGFLLNRRREQRSSTSNPITAAWTTRRDTTAVVHDDQALRLAAVFACWRIIAGIGSTLPLRQLRGDQPIPRDPIWDEPEPNAPLPDWLHRLWTSLLADGNAYGIVISDQPTQVDGVALIDPRRVAWRAVNNQLIPHLDGQPTGRWPAGRLWHLPLFTRPGNPIGMSPLRAAATAIETGLAADSWVRRWMRTSGAPLSVLRVDDDITPDEAAVLKARFTEAATAGDPVVMTSKIEWSHTGGISPDDAQFLETSRWSAAQIAAVFGVPPEWVGANLSGTNITYANRESFWQDFLARDLQPMLVRVEAGLSQLLPAGQRVKFNVDALLRADLKSRYDSYKTAAEIEKITGRPLLTVDEMRLLEDRPLITTDTTARIPSSNANS